MAPNITQDEYGNISFDGPEAVNIFRLVAMRSALQLELDTGLRHSRVNIKAAAEQVLGKTFPRSRKGKQACIDALQTRLEEIKAEATAERKRRLEAIANGEFGPSSTSQ
jgi:hypothetical protein